nr:NADH deshydrogenase subunit 5 [Xorides funiuensis]
MYLYVYIIYIFLIMLLLFFLGLYFLIFKLNIYMEFNLIKFLSLKFEILIFLDWISLIFMSVVMLISSMVILYSLMYMKSDLYINRFMYLILLFILSMMLMILSPNFLSILFGWDGLGLISYCLVIYYQNNNSFNSGLVTVLINRVGDIVMLMLIGLLMSLGSWNFMFYDFIDNLLLFMVVIISFTKSAQIPFSSWLPLAMAAPTPVSSLVHSSTLVTAGVYLLIRFNYLIMMNYYIMKLIMFISLMTMFMAGMGANFEYDFKKIIALSTLSQLGVMIFSLSLGLDIISFFHLLTHAMFKSMLFMSAGVIIHNMMGFQDIRYINMVLMNMPLVSIMMINSLFSLCGIPFMSGFFSKDLILEMFMMSIMNKFILMILFMSMGLTLMYSLRLMYYSFIKLSYLNLYMKFSLFNNLMINSMFILFIFSLSMGVILSWLIFSMKNFIILSFSMKMLIYLFMMLGGMMMFFIQKIFLSLMKIKNLLILINFISMMWFLPLLYNYNIKYVMKFSNNLIYFMEMGWLEYFLSVNLIIFIKNFLSGEFIMKNYFSLFILMNFFIMIFLLN